MTELKKIILKKGKTESLSRRHPWIFSGAIESVPDSVREGDLVVCMSCGDLYKACDMMVGKA